MSFRIGLSSIAAVLLFVLTADIAHATDCPLAVSSVGFEGQGLAGHVDKYRVVLTGASDSAATATTIGITLRGVTAPLSTTVDGLTFTGANGKYWTSVTFFRPSDDVTAVAVLSAKPPRSDVVNCANAPVAAGGRGADEDLLGVPSMVETFDDATTRAPIGLDASTGPSRDAEFVSQSKFNPPFSATDGVAEGTAIIGVRIAATGPPQFVWVDRSSGDKALDAAALDAASSSTYRPQVIDGRAVTTTYRIIYDVRIEITDPERAEITTGRPCDAWTGMLSLEAAVQGTSVRWYDGTIYSVGKALADIAFVVDGASGSRNVSWSHIPSDFKTRSGLASTNIAVYWPYAYASSIFVKTARRAGASKANTCPDAPSYIDNTVRSDTLMAWNPTDKPAITAPEIEVILPARFATLAWPKFSGTDDNKYGPIAVTVEVRTSDSGAPIAAFIQDTQYTAIFSRAALNAAMASTYVMPVAPDGSLMTHTFEVMYVYESMK